MKELSKQEILEAYKSLASSPRYRLSELEIFTMAVRWMEEQNKGKESMKEITEITDYPMNIKDLVAHTNTNSLSLFDLKPDYNVEFHIDGRRIGRLDFNGGVMVFEGDAEESAKIFFDALAEKFADRLKEEREKEREACAQIADEEAQLFGITDDVVAHRIRERGEDRFEIKEDRIHKDLPGRRVAKAAGARIEE